MSRKDELLDAISKIQQQMEDDKTRLKVEEEEFAPLKEQVANLFKALKQIQEQYEAADKKKREKDANIRYLGQNIKLKSAELDRLKRELGRELDTERINEEYQRQVEAFKERCLDAPWRAENRTDGLGAKPHQIEGAIHAAITKQILLADKRGLGKSLTSIIWFDFIEAQRVIAIVPSDTMDNYIRELRLWAPHRQVLKLGKMNKLQRDFVLSSIKNVAQYVLVLNYEAWRKDSELIPDLISLKADTLILDEAHKGKTMSTTTAQGIHDLRFGVNLECPDCGGEDFKTYQAHDIVQCKICGWEGDRLAVCSIKNVMPMTGTPILNKPQELFPQLRLINPENFRRESQFLQDFCYKSGNRWYWVGDGEKNVVKKIGPRYLARDRKSAGVIIPPPTPITHLLTMDEMAESYPKQYKAYKQARDYAQIVLDPDREIAMSMPVFLTVLLRLRQVLTWPDAIELKITNAETGEKEVFAKLNVSQSIKLDKAEELIREITEEGDRVVLFSQFKAPLHELQNRLGNRAVVYDGETSGYTRNLIQLDFDIKTAPKEPRWDVVLGNYKAMAEGLNLNAASHMIILDEEWNPGRQEQAYGRIDRLGQTKETMIHTIRVEDSVDTWMADLIEEKRNIVGGFEVEADMAQRMFDALRNGKL